MFKNRLFFTWLVLLIALLYVSPVQADQNAVDLLYTLTIEDPGSHLLKVKLEISNNTSDLN